MADYNIFIHSVTNYQSPTTPVQLRENADPSGVGGEGGEGGSGFGMARRAASFVTNPDSLIAKAGNFLTSPAGKLGVVAFAIKALIDIGKKVITTYQSFYAPSTGDYAFQTKYNNFNQTVNALSNPFSTEISVLQRMYEIKRQDKAREQEMLLTGGTAYNSRYGRYL